MSAPHKPCVLCGNTQPLPRLKKGGYVILRCPECRLTYLDLAPDAKFLDALYSEDYFANSACASGYSDYLACETHLKRNFIRRLKSIEAAARPGNILDIGCGPGFFLEVLPPAWNAFGVEISPFAAEIAKKKGLNVIRGEFSAASFEPDFFDVITLWDAIEHLPNPVAALRDVNKIMKPGGSLFISTGNVESIFARICGVRWHLYNLPEHLYFFSPRTLAAMLKQTGFEVKSHNYETCYYSLSYIFERISKSFGHQPAKNATLLSKISIPINLFDISTIRAQKILA